MLSRNSATYLFDHILDGFKTTHAGIESLQQMGLVDHAECMALHKKNSERLIERIKEFKVMQKIMCVFFAALFTWMQIGNEDLEMRRAKRHRSSRRRNEKELII